MLLEEQIAERQERARTAIAKILSKPGGLGFGDYEVKSASGKTYRVAGGVGLNLQAASAVVNFEPPWNPARLEQRIGRVHRLGQFHPVQVIHLLTEGSIEERVWETLRLKKALFSGLFDATADEVSFEKLGRKTMMQAIKEVFADQPAAPPKPVIQPPKPAPVPVAVPLPAPPPAPDYRTRAADFLEAGLKFLESLAPPAAERRPATGSQLETAISSLLRTDPQTQRPVLAIPVPEVITAERLAGAIGGLLSRLTGASL